MLDPARIANLLVDKVTERRDPDHRRPRANSREQKVTNHPLKVTDDVSTCASYEVELEMTLDHDDDEVTDSDDGSLDPNFEETEEEDKLQTKENFSLEFMKKLVEFYDSRN